MKKRIAIVGGGPSGMFMYKRFVDAASQDVAISIFERKSYLGAGMPYSVEGSNYEHITNVSGNEIPEIVTPISEWIKTIPQETLDLFKINKDKFNDYRVLPRLLFGQYLAAQFDMLFEIAEKNGLETHVHLQTDVIDIVHKTSDNKVWIETSNAELHKFDSVIICSGHNWPKTYEGKVPGYFDSPYPPSKLAIKLNHPVAIKGSSLTAIDAIRTLARQNGSFSEKNGLLHFNPADDMGDFKIVMHSRSGLLPAVRFHLEDTHLQNDSLLTPEEINAHRLENDGFLSLDYLFEKDFKRIFLEKDPKFYDYIKHMSIEDFVHAMLELREHLDPFLLLKAEYKEAEKSIKQKESVYWKEMLAVLSFAMNYPAKYLSAEDMIRLQKVLMPLISIVIAFVPQASCREMLALHEAGILEIIPVGSDSRIEIQQKGGINYTYKDEHGKEQSTYYKTFIDCVGQPHLSYEDFPFKSLITDKVISPAMIKFKSASEGMTAMSTNNSVIKSDAGNYYLKVSGITINDHFQVVDAYGAFNDQIYIMAVPYIGGYNPDYSGLDFCEAASGKIVEVIVQQN